VTGPPGAGKSTLVSSLVQSLRASGRTVGVVAVDPTSPFTGGALLGDRIRMQDIGCDTGVFVRSMATRGSLGGLAEAAGDVADVLDAFGYDVVITETVGVGQCELDIAQACYTTIVVIVPESGDSVQAMKSGLMEIADIIVINKSDREGAERIAAETRAMLELRRPHAYGPSHGDAESDAHHGTLASGGRGESGESSGHSPGESSGHSPGESGGHSLGAGEGKGSEAGGQTESIWQVPVLQTIASRGEGIAELSAAVERHKEFLRASGMLERHRKANVEATIRGVVDLEMYRRVWNEASVSRLHGLVADVTDGRKTPRQASDEILSMVRDLDRKK
jgi:LAO/AO transport system kinase